MESLVSNKPIINVTPKITKISNLARSAEEIKRTSTKLRKTFERGIYQKKTQISVLNKYKKRLDSIQKQNDKKFTAKQRVKIKLPEVKKYAGSFFSSASSNDPLKSIGALAAFNALQKGFKGDVAGALGPALVAAGIFFGPSLLRGGIGLIRGGSPGLSKAGVQSTPKSLSSGSISRLNASQARFIQGKANIGDRARLIRRGFISPTGAFSKGGPEQAAKYGSNTTKVGKAFGRFGKAILPGVGAAVGAIDATLRAQEGDVTGSAIAGTSASLDALALASAATGVGVPVAGLLSIASFGLDVINLVRDLSGASEREAQKNKPQQDRLKKQTEEQKKLVEEKKKDNKKLTFGKSLDRYERVVNKFEEFSKGFAGGMGVGVDGYEENIPLRQPTPITDPYTGPISGETFLPLPGATSIGDPSQGQNFGAGRGGRTHQGIDLTERVQQDSRAPIVAYKTGRVIKVERGDIYPGGGIEIDHGGGLITRYLHVTPSVNVGDIVYGGQQIGNLFRYFGRSGEQTHLHFEVYQDNQLMNPTSYVTGVKNKISTPLSYERAKQHNESTLKTSSGMSAETQQIQQTGTYTVAGVTYDTKTGSPVRTTTQTPRVTIPSAPRRSSIGQYTSYERPSMDQVIPVTVPIPQQQMMGGGAQEQMFIPGPSEQDLLNSFYKRVLLNTV